MRFYWEQGKFPSKAFSLFNFQDLDPFYLENVNILIYGSKWQSVLIENGKDAILHNFPLSPIGQTEYYDIEPLLGYSGPITNSHDTSFIESALKIYSTWCVQVGIVAELIRFNPISRNHLVFDGRNPHLQCLESKPIAYMDLSPNVDVILARYSQSCRYKVKKGLKKYSCSINNKL